MPDLQPIFDAFQAHQWVLFGALLVGLLLAVAKQGWLSARIQAWLPPVALPYYAVGLGILTLMVADIKSGKTWQQALFDGVAAGIAAVFAHETVIEGLRGGKEIIPARWPDKTPPAQGPFRENANPTPPDSKAPPANMRIFSRVIFPFGACIFLIVSWISGCTQQGAKTATTVALDVVQMACIEASQLTTAQEVATACKIDQDLTPALQQFLNDLIGQREAAKRAGFHWTAGAAAGTTSTTDGG